MPPPSNFHFLAKHDPLLAELGAAAERVFPFDPASSVVKLRLLAEALTQDIAARLGIRLQQPTQAELLRAVDARLGMDAQIRQMFDLLRRRGNQAAHEAAHGVSYREGLDALKVARELAVWFHRSFGGGIDFKPGAFLPPDDPSRKLAELHAQVAALQTQLQTVQHSQATQDALAEALTAQAAQERNMAAHAQQERALYEELASEANRSNLDIAASIVGHIRQAALGEALIPFELRVDRAMQGIYATRAWTPVQKNWLARLARQLTHEVVVDPAFVNTAFAADGGARQLDKLLGGGLEQVMQDLATGLWTQAA